jgi:hypothetical protein
MGRYRLASEQTPKSVRMLVDGEEALKATFDERSRLTEPDRQHWRREFLKGQRWAHNAPSVR